MDDENLLNYIARSETDALSELYDRYSRLVFSVAYQATADSGLAEETTQETFIRVWENALRYNPQLGKVATWLASIARNYAIDLFRRAQTRPESRSTSLDAMPDFNLSDEGQNVELSVELTQRRERLQAALSQLPKEQRQTLALAYFRGYTQDEIASLCSVPTSTTSAFCNRVETGSTINMKVANVATQANNRFITRSADAGVETNYHIQVSDYIEGLPSKGSVSAYIRGTLKEGGRSQSVKIRMHWPVREHSKIRLNS